MDMVEDYLRALSHLLPKSKRDDIIAELRDEILTRIEVKEAELGRPLTPDETEQVLRDFGHPLVVAARYSDEPQYAVGPALYPFWTFAVRLIVLIQIAITALMFVGRVIGGSHVGDAFAAAIGTGLTGAMTLIGFATVAAWVIERKRITIDYLNTWRVRDLRFLDVTAWTWDDLKDGSKPRERMTAPYHVNLVLRRSVAGHGIGTVVGATLVILWWTGVIRFGLGSMDLSALPVDFGGLAAVDWTAIKATLYWPVLAYLAAVVVLGATMLPAAVIASPRVVRLRGAVDIITGAATLAFVAWIWFLSPLAPIVSVASVQELVDRVVALFTVPFSLSVPTVAMLILLGTAWEGLCRVLLGLWEALSGIPRQGYWRQS